MLSFPHDLSGNPVPGSSLFSGFPIEAFGNDKIKGNPEL